jgi:hypothetical protein
MVSLAAILAFLHAHGLDAYDVDSDPSPRRTGSPNAATEGAARLNSIDLAQCRMKVLMDLLQAAHSP